jgi:hypothetical protein
MERGYSEGDILSLIAKRKTKNGQPAFGFVLNYSERSGFDFTVYTHGTKEVLVQVSGNDLLIVLYRAFSVILHEEKR